MLNEQQKIKFLKVVFLFKEMSEKGLRILSEHTSENHYKKGDIIFNEGEIGNNLHIIVSGKVKILKLDKNGKEKNLAILKGKDSFGEMALLTKELRSATVQALTDVITLSIDANAFEDLIKKEPSIPLNIIKTLSERLAKSDRQIKNLAFGNAKEKIISVLYDIIEDNKAEVSHQELANLAGLTRETATRTLNRLKKEGIIDIKRKKIIIKDLEKIKEIIL